MCSRTSGALGIVTKLPAPRPKYPKPTLDQLAGILLVVHEKPTLHLGANEQGNAY
jgi:hypothetical protein